MSAKHLGADSVSSVAGLKWAGWGAIHLQQPKWLATPFIRLSRINAVSLAQLGIITPTRRRNGGLESRSHPDNLY